MLKLKMIPVLMKVTGKLDIKPAIEAIKKLDIFENTDDAQNAVAQLTSEKAIEVCFVIFGELCPQLPKIADDIPVLVAEHKGITVEEAGELDALESIKELITDSGVVSFFIEQLRKTGKLNS